MAEVPEQLKKHAFKPGQSGNPSGRPKNTLKDYQRKKFTDMDDKEKEEYLNEIPKGERWRMAEGNPHQTEEKTLEANITIVAPTDVIDILNENTDTNT